MDSVASDLGWARYSDHYPVKSGRLNADYVIPGYIIELKIIEEEGLDKKERQEKLAKLYASAYPNQNEIDISLENTPEEIRRKVENIVSGPIQTAVKKASNQIRETSEDLDLDASIGILVIVNNGYSYLEADAFENLVVRRCANDSSRISYAFCVTVEYHQGEFDAYILCRSRCHAIHSNTPWEHEEQVRNAVQRKFNGAMTIMMSDQMNPDLWSERLGQVRDIRFDSDGVNYVRNAPEVPNSVQGKNRS